MGPYPTPPTPTQQVPPCPPTPSPSCALHLSVGSGAWPGPVGGGPAHPLTHPCSLTCHCFLLPPGSVPQPPGKALTGRSVGPSSALPGDPYNSAVGPANFRISPSASSDSGEGSSVRPPPMSSAPSSSMGQPMGLYLVPSPGGRGASYTWGTHAPGSPPPGLSSSRRGHGQDHPRLWDRTSPTLSCSGLGRTQLACAWGTSQTGSGGWGEAQPPGLAWPPPAPALCSSSALQGSDKWPKPGRHSGSREGSAGLRASLFSHSWTLGPGVPSLVRRGPQQGLGMWAQALGQAPSCSSSPA